MHSREELEAVGAETQVLTGDIIPGQTHWPQGISPRLLPLPSMLLPAFPAGKALLPDNMLCCLA